MSVDTPIVIRAIERVKACVSRPKGREVAQYVLERMGRNQVMLDLSGAPAYTSSFIDELAFRLSQAGKLASVVFQYDDDAVRERLERVVRFRPELQLRVMGPAGEETLKAPAAT